MTPCEAFHVFVDELEDEMARPALHAVIDALPGDLLPVALERMRALRAGLALLPPNLSATAHGPPDKGVSTT